MPQLITNPYAVRGLAQEFGLQHAPRVFGDEVYAFADVSDHGGRSPFAGRRIGAQITTAAAGGVGIYSGLLIRPGLGTDFVVEQIVVEVAAATTVQLRLCRPADVALLTLGSATPFGCLNESVAQSGFIPTLGATLTDNTRNSRNTGGLFGRVIFPANTHLPHVPPRGIVLRGARAETATSLLLVHNADNTQLAATIYGTEYVAPVPLAR